MYFEILNITEYLNLVAAKWAVQVMLNVRPKEDVDLTGFYTYFLDVFVILCTFRAHKTHVIVIVWRKLTHLVNWKDLIQCKNVCFSTETMNFSLLKCKGIKFVYLSNFWISAFVNRFSKSPLLIHKGCGLKYKIYLRSSLTSSSTNT